MKKWECTVCGYIHEGEDSPEKCPVCGAGKEKFVEVTLSQEGDADLETRESNPTALEATGPQVPAGTVEKIAGRFEATCCCLIS